MLCACGSLQMGMLQFVHCSLVRLWRYGCLLSMYCSRQPPVHVDVSRLLQCVPSHYHKHVGAGWACTLLFLPTQLMVVVLAHFHDSIGNVGCAINGHTCCSTSAVGLCLNRYPTTLQEDEELLLEPQHSNLGPRLQAAVAARAERKRLLHLAAQLLQEYEQRVARRQGLPVGESSATAAA